MTLSLTADWNTGDINLRSSQACAVLDAAGGRRIMAPVQHGATCFSATGALLWTYTGITNGYDVRDIVAADLTGSGRADCAIVCSGYYATTTDGKIALLGPDGTLLQLLRGTDFVTSPARIFTATVDGTDIYVASSEGVTKFVKSGSIWVEDATNWAKAQGSCNRVVIDDAGNGPRVYVIQNASGHVYCYQKNGTLDWDYTIGNTYVGTLAVARFDVSKTGKQIAVGYQGGIRVLDKDGNLSASITTSNVCCSITAFDPDGDGIADLYHTDMGRNIVRYGCTAADTYTQVTNLSTLIASGQFAGVTHYDLDEDGTDELIIVTTDGHLYVYSPDLVTQKVGLNIGHGQAGGFYTSNVYLTNGIAFADLDGDGHADLAISGQTGYVDTYLASGFAAGPVGQDESGGSAAGTSTSALGAGAVAEVGSSGSVAVMAVSADGAGSARQVTYWSDPVVATVGGPQTETGGSAAQADVTATGGTGVIGDRLSGGSAVALAVSAVGIGVGVETASGGAVVGVVGTTASGTGVAVERSSSSTSSTDVPVSATGLGQTTEYALSGSATAVSITATGDALLHEHAQGGGAAFVTVTAVATGGTTEQQVESGGADVVVLMTADGAGASFDLVVGGADAAASVDAVGAGVVREHITGGAQSDLVVTAAGSGVSGESEHATNGSTASLSVSVTGAGVARERVRAGSTASVPSAADGIGRAFERVLDGAPAWTRAVAGGDGIGFEIASSGSGALVNVILHGDGRVLEPLSGGSEAAILVDVFGDGELAYYGAYTPALRPRATIEDNRASAEMVKHVTLAVITEHDTKAIIT